MKTLNVIKTVGFLTLVFSGLTSNALASSPQVLLKCALSSDTQTMIGFFTSERNNNGVLAFDIYSANDKHKQVKQIGHIDVTPNTSILNGITPTGTLLVSSTSDSPFKLNMSLSATVPAPVSPSNPTPAPADGKLVGTVTALALFTGQPLTKADIKCKSPKSASSAPVRRRQAISAPAPVAAAPVVDTQASANNSLNQFNQGVVIDSNGQLSAAVPAAPSLPMAPAMLGNNGNPVDPNAAAAATATTL